jgi:predicted transcriptional regulator
MHTLKDKFSDVDKQTTRAMSSLNTLITERLRADDDVLQALSNLASKTAPSSQSGSVDPSTIDQWCQALIMLRESETNSHIDAALNNHICDIIESGGGSQQSRHVHDEADLHAELRTLREEIPSVVELVVASSLRQPLLRLMRGTRHQAIVRQSEWLHYILDTFGHMINQLHLISSHATKLHAYSHALSEVRSALDALQNPNSSSTSSAVTPPTTSYAGPSRPMHARSDSRAGASAAGNVSLAEQTCKRFAISRPSASALEAASASATAKMLEQYATATSTTQEVISKALDEQSRNLESALGELYAHSRYASVELLPRDLERDVKALDEAIAATVVGLEGAEKGKHENVKQVIAQIKEKLQPTA